jgi:hypothetical protein
VLRDQTKGSRNSLCEITFPGWSNSSDWINSVYASIKDGNGGVCQIDICLISQCTPTQKNGKGDILGYENCECDVAIGVNDTDNKFLLYTVAYKDANQTKPNVINLIGLFETYSLWENDGAPDGPTDFFGIPINTATYPNVVPRFRTLQDLADRMRQVLTKATEINSIVTIKYTAGNPGSLIFGLVFEKYIETPSNGLSFSSKLELGDLASVVVEDASFGLSGGIRVAAEFGIVFGPDEKSSLTLVGQRTNENETSSCNATAFNVTIHYEKNNTEGNETIVIVSKCDIKGKLSSLQEAFSKSRLGSDVNVSEIGSSGLFALTFDSVYSYARVTVANGTENDLKRYGLVNGEYEKKSQFQFTIGLFDLTAETELTGNAAVTANVADVLEVTADVDATLFGQVRFAAGKQGQLIPFDDWLATLIAIKDNTSEYYVDNFAVASLTFDGNIAATVSVEDLGLSTTATGRFEEPYKLNLLSLGVIPRPKFALDVDLPNFGDLRNLSFGDLINLLNQALELLVGSEEADTVESCTGGLLGGDFFAQKIPVIGKSACDFAGALKVVVDAVDTLVNECSGCTNSSDSSEDPTFKALEVKLENLLQQGNIVWGFCESE